jgi:long-chain acyl-CoA synthetase
MAVEVRTTQVEESLGDALERAGGLFGDKEAVVDGDRRLTYSELERRVAGLGGGLAGLGVEPGTVVAALMLNSLPHFEYALGVPRIGAVVNDLNYRLAPAELAFILSDSEATVLVVDDMFLDAGRRLAEECDTVQHLVYAGAGEVPDGLVPYEDLVAADPAPVAGGRDQLAGIYYTGGTTGLPKGVMLTHANLIANAKHSLIGLGYDSNDRYLHAGPMFHLADGAATFAITWVGGTHVFVPAFEPEAVLRIIEAESVTTMALVPTMINMLVHHEAVHKHDLSSVRRVLYGGSPIPLEVQRTGARVFDCAWIQAYGMTEAAPIVTLCHVDVERALRGEEPHATRLRSAGTPIVGVRAEIRHADGSRAAPGEVGEVWVRGPNVMAGYWQRPEETAQALTEDGWYRSGDAAYADEDGYLYVVDRVKDMIISGGENVYCSEVENALHEHEAVVEAAAFGVPDERWGERVHAVVAVQPGAEVDADALIAHCRERIAAYKLPRSMDLRDEPLPKSGAGKVLKRDLREPYWEGREHRVA